MRIRRRPPGVQPLAYLLPTDPYPPAQSSPPPPSRDPPPPGHKQQGEGELHLHPNDSAADLGAARSSSSPLSRPALPPQDDGAVVERSRGGGLLGPQQQQQQLQQGPADGRSSSSLENGLHRQVPEPATTQAGELLSNNGVGAAAAVTTPATTGAKASKKQNQETKDTSGGGTTKRPPRGPGTLLEGSRCSRKNGRGWRCSQPTLVGYALCQYHLGKGRMKSGSAATTVGRGPGQLGRTEHTAKKSSATAVAPATAVTGKRGPGQLGITEHAAKKTSAAAAAVAPATSAAAPKVDVPPPQPPSVQQC